jgi:putative ABC transport system permease protein
MRFEHWIYTIPLRLRSLLQRGRVDAELDKELRDHIERQMEENLARGMSAEEARRAALIAMGGLEQRKQQCQETHGVHWIDDLARDLTYGLRSMRRSPGFTITALLTLALGIGANTAIFSADHALLFRTLPYRNPDRLVEVFQKEISDPAAGRMPVAPANYHDWQAQSKLFEAFAAWQATSLNLSDGDNPERMRAAKVSANLFSVLEVEPMLGRSFRRGEDAPGAGRLVVLSYELWQRRFGGSRDVVGKTIRADDQTWTVIGVMPQDFRFPVGWVSSDVEAWTPLVLTDSERTSRKDITLMVIARLRAGVTLAQAQAGLAAVARHLAQAYPDADKDWSVNISPMSNAGIGDFRGLFVLLSAAVGLVLLIACANVANLLLARGMGRQKELTVRMALGARSSRVIRQLMTEGLLLAVIGGVLGIGLGYGGNRMLAFLAPAMELRDLKHMALDGPVLALSLGLSIMTGFLFSVLPALTLSRISPGRTLNQTGRNSTGTVRSNRLKAALVAGEVALTLALLLCAGDILKSFFTYMRIDPGFDAHHVLTMHMALPQEKYRNPQQWAGFFQRLVEEIGTIPGVTAAAAGSGAPMEGAGSVLRFHVGGERAEAGIDERWILEHLSVSPDYFRVTGMSLVRGRGILASDKVNAPPVVVINEKLSRKQFGNANPIGRRIFLDGDVNQSAVVDTAGPSLVVVGVVRDIKEYGLFQITPQMIYVPLAQDPESSASLLVKTTVPPDTVLPAIRGKIAKLDSEQPVYNVESLEDIFWQEHSFFRFNTLLISVFAGMALLLSLIGIYGVVAYEVSQRTREFGIRLALGSSRRGLLLLVLRDAAWMAMAGIGIGLALAWPAVRLLTRTLQESMFLTLVRTGPMLFPALCAAIIITLLLACLIPARWATQADPMQALRYE